MTPEVYTAYAYLKAGSVFLLIIPALHVFPLAALFVILLGIMIYYKEIQKADEMLKEKREQIEEELYRFVSTITHYFSYLSHLYLLLEQGSHRPDDFIDDDGEVGCQKTHQHGKRIHSYFGWYLGCLRFQSLKLRLLKIMG